MFRIFSTIHQIELGKFPGDHLLLEVVFQEPWDLYGATKKKHGKWKDLKQWRIQGGARRAEKIFLATAPTPPPPSPSPSEGNSALLPADVDRRLTARFNEFAASHFKLYNKSLWDWSLRKQVNFLASNLNVSLGNKINCFPRHKSLSVYYWPKGRSQSHDFASAGTDKAKLCICSKGTSVDWTESLIKNRSLGSYLSRVGLETIISWSRNTTKDQEVRGISFTHFSLYSWTNTVTISLNFSTPSNRSALNVGWIWRRWLATVPA